MVSVVLVGIWLALLAYQIYKWMVFRPKNFPPGPPRLPIFGAYPYMLLLNYKHLHKAVDWLCKYYKTEVLGLYAAGYTAIVANSTATVRELLNNKDLDGKPKLTLVKLRSPDFVVRGIFMSDGELWHEQRRYTLRNLRDFGFGCRHKELEMELNDELLIMIDLIKNGPKYDFEKRVHNGDSAMVPAIFNATAGNFLMKVLLNERLPREKYHLFYEASYHAYQFAFKSDSWGKLFSLVDWVPKLFPKLSGYDELRDLSMKFYDAIKAIVDDQYKTYDPSHERHFMDMYFKKIEETADDARSTHSYKQLVGLVVDLFFANFLGNTTQLQFILQRLCWSPEILKNCQDEIEKVIGSSRLPHLDDRVHMPYLEATIRESFRHDTQLVFGVAHAAVADTKLHGYDIPKGTVAFAGLYGAHKDLSVWDEPELYKPERFLNESGQLSTKMDKTLAFGLGKHVCAGETFARNTLFLVLATIIQNFNLAEPKNEKLPRQEDDLTGIIRHAPEYRLKFLPR